MSKVWHISGFDGEDTPHWDSAIIEAPTAEAAVAHLRLLLEANLPETVWGPILAPQEWSVREFDGEFVLGGGCR